MRARFLCVDPKLGGIWSVRPCGRNDGERNPSAKTNTSSGMIQVYGGCGQWMKYNPRTKKCESF
jgi:hypothetical protein